MIKLIIISLFSLISIACRPYNMALPASCGTETINHKQYEKLCVEKDSVAPSFKITAKDKYRSHTVFGHSNGSATGPQVDWILGGDNTIIDFNYHYFDAYKNEAAWINFRGKELIIKNGILLNIDKITFGFSYYAPEFNKQFQENNNIEKWGYIYSNEDREFHNLNFDSFKIITNFLDIRQWNTTISNSDILVKNSIMTHGSLTHLKNNNIYKTTKGEVLVEIPKTSSSQLIDKTNIILPDEPDPNLAALYIKFSPDVVIDGNTIKLDNFGNTTYAIVLDHSPRVRITNNTFNGFKVPILMDQWSSIVDENGKEIKPENFNAYGNTINPNKYAGNVTMNRKGEIVKE